MKENKMMIDQPVSWRDYPAWLTDFQGSVLESLATPLEIAAFEAEQFTGSGRGKGPSFSFELDKSLGESYLLEKPAPDRIVVRGGERGILYGTYEALFDLSCERPLPCGLQSPACSLRMLDSWDNTDGTVERGYAGRSLWFEGGGFSYDPDRIRQLGRMLASVGINVLCINNVNVDASARSLIGDLLPQAAEFANLLRPFGIRLMLSVDFSSPMFLKDPDPASGGNDALLQSADPLDEAVRRWWRHCAAHVYWAIPDLAGFLVKADSEHRPGPNTYGRSHAEGANMLAAALAPYGGKLVWRAFIYNCMQDWRDTDTDRPCAAYDVYQPLDGSFADNVILQIKNGPYDFQVREPVSPLLLGLEKTDTAVELQLTQEYTGHQIDLFSMPPLWREIFDRIGKKRIRAAAAVSNLGRDDNWTGHPFAALNLFAFGRYAWDPDQNPEDVIRQWIRLSGYREDEEKLTDLLLRCSRTYEKYTAPLGLCWMVNPGGHYGPSPWGYEFQAWGTYNRADRDAVGIDRTAAGTGFLKQYPPEVAKRYEDPEACPDEYLLFFHRLPYSFVMRDGRTLIQRIYDDHFEGFEEVLGMQKLLSGLHLPERDRQLVKERMELQVRNAREWRDVTNTFFHRLSGIPDRNGRMIYD
ncbi:MAG: alpha-glucuronidase [Oscillospiraceae bacterium]|nr:alpha-glucuronidase [Oscillospiraceae bacterium]